MKNEQFSVDADEQAVMHFWRESERLYNCRD
jgi:hypothetical protein